MSTEPTADHRLDGAIAVVTGAAQGLGLAMVEQLARNGAEVTIADLQLEKAEAQLLHLRAELDELNAELEERFQERQKDPEIAQTEEAQWLSSLSARHPSAGHPRS